jgi:hypothetical protein
MFAVILGGWFKKGVEAAAAASWPHSRCLGRGCTPFEEERDQEGLLIPELVAGREGRAVQDSRVLRREIAKGEIAVLAKGGLTLGGVC